MKTFKRDHPRINPLPDAATALQQISGWTKDENRLHSHSTQCLRSPSEPSRAMQTEHACPAKPGATP